MNIKTFITLIIFLITVGVQAHQPNLSSTILIEQEENKWVLQLRSALTAFENEVHTRYSKDSYKTPEEFKNRVIDFLSQNIEISFDENQKVAIKNPRVQLGHETIVSIEFEAPKEFKSIHIENSSFKNGYNSKSLFLILKEGFEKNRFSLDKTNDYKISLIADGTEFKKVNTVQNKASSSNIVLLILSLMIIPFVFLLKKKLNND